MYIAISLLSRLSSAVVVIIISPLCRCHLSLHEPLALPRRHGTSAWATGTSCGHAQTSRGSGLIGQGGRIRKMCVCCICTGAEIGSDVWSKSEQQVTSSYCASSSWWLADKLCTRRNLVTWSSFCHYLLFSSFLYIYLFIVSLFLLPYLLLLGLSFFFFSPLYFFLLTSLFICLFCPFFTHFLYCFYSLPFRFFLIWQNYIACVKSPTGSPPSI